MLISAVVDPDAFHKKHFARPGYPEHAETFLNGIEYNGVLLFDPEGRLKTQLLNNVHALPSSRKRFQASRK